MTQYLRILVSQVSELPHDEFLYVLTTDVASSHYLIVPRETHEFLTSVGALKEVPTESHEDRLRRERKEAISKIMTEVQLDRSVIVQAPFRTKEKEMVVVEHTASPSPEPPVRFSSPLLDSLAPPAPTYPMNEDVRPILTKESLLSLAKAWKEGALNEDQLQRAYGIFCTAPVSMMMETIPYLDAETRKSIALDRHEVTLRDPAERPFMPQALAAFAAGTFDPVVQDSSGETMNIGEQFLSAEQRMKVGSGEGVVSDVAHKLFSGAGKGEQSQMRRMFDARQMRPR